MLKWHEPWRRSLAGPAELLGPKATGSRQDGHVDQSQALCRSAGRSPGVPVMQHRPGRRCSCCNAAPWTRCAVRRRGSPRRQTSVNDLPVCQPRSSQWSAAARLWPPEIMAAKASQHPGPHKWRPTAVPTSVFPGRRGPSGARLGVLTQSRSDEVVGTDTSASLVHGCCGVTCRVRIIQLPP